MDLSPLMGNPRVKEQLGRGLSHAYLISGPEGSGRHTLAKLLCAAMVCAAPGERPCGRCPQCKKAAADIHPDITTVSGPGGGKPITVDQIRTVRTDAYIRPNEAARKIYLLENADKMNASAQNAMLKLLEDGPQYAAFLLLCGNSGGLLPTVRSRCEELSLAPVPVPECRQWLETQFPERAPQQLQDAALACQGILGRAVAQLKGKSEEEQARETLTLRLADAVQRGSEGELFQETMALEKGGKDDLPLILDALETELTARMASVPDRRRLYRGVSLVRELKAAAALNANPGQVAGWLCAGMFTENESR